MTSKSVALTEDKIDYSKPIYTKQIIGRNRIKRRVKYRHPWNSELVTYVCQVLKDPCERASFLRLHTEHEICFNIPPLYLLPHIDADLNDVIEGSDQSPATSPQPCDTAIAEVRIADGLYRKYLETSERCQRSLEALDAKIRSTLNQDLDSFQDILNRSCYTLDNFMIDKMEEECEQCKNAYKSWLCSTMFPIYYPLVKLPPPESPEHRETVSTASSLTSSTTLPSSSITTAMPSQATSSQLLRNLSTTSQPYRSRRQREFHLLRQRDGGESTLGLERIPACVSWCTKVETLCSYYNPSNNTQNGGEPAFLCDESHYQYALPDDGSHSSCEYGCCFTEQDLEMDADVTLETRSSGTTTSSPTPPSAPDLTKADEALSPEAIEARIWNLEPSNEDRSEVSQPVSLRERCFRIKLFSRDLGVPKFDEGSSSSSCSASLSSSFTLAPNAFLAVTLAAFLG